MEALRCCSYVVIYMNLRRVLSRYKKPSRECAGICGRMANGEWRMANGEWRMANGRLALEGDKRKRQISICRLRG
jgi:glucokinase